jgi:hypothetical protein
MHRFDQLTNLMYPYLDILIGECETSNFCKFKLNVCGTEVTSAAVMQYLANIHTNRFYAELSKLLVSTIQVGLKT